MLSSSSSSTALSNSCTAFPVSAESRVPAATTASDGALSLPVGQTRCWTGVAEGQQYEWPPRSCRRMRAGLRSALKTECSGFKFQNGGRSLRWFKELPRDDWVNTTERARLFWQGHVSLFEQHWDVLKPKYPLDIWLALDQLDSTFHERSSVNNATSRAPAQSHAQAMAAMLVDGNVERAVRWGLNPRSGMESMLFSFEHDFSSCILLALALLGGWTWLLERWQSAAGSTSDAKDRWPVLLAVGAIETGCLRVVQEYCSHVQALGRRIDEVSATVGRSGSVDVFDWLVKHSSAVGDQGDSPVPALLLEAAAEYGHVTFMEHILSREPRTAQQQVFTEHRRELLQCSCVGGHLHAVEWLVSRRDAVPDTDALRVAAQYGHYPIVRYLCDQAGASSRIVSDCSVGDLLYDSKSDCLAVLEYLVHHSQHAPTSFDVAHAAIAANVRSDVLRFLAKHASREAWASAFSHERVGSDLEVQDLLRAAARDSSAARPLA